MADFLESIKESKKEPAEKPAKEPIKKEEKEETLQSEKAPKPGQGTQKFLNIKEIKEGCVILKSGALRAIVMISSINFDLLSAEEQKGKIFAYQEFLNSLDFPIQIVIQSKRLNIENYIEKLEELKRSQENELLRIQTTEYIEYIRNLVRLANITTTHFYIVVPYSGEVVKTGFLDNIKKLLSPAAAIKKKEEVFEAQKEKIDLRINHIISASLAMGLQAAALGTQELVELLYAVYNPDISADEVLGELEKLDIREPGE